jgi:DNA-directed RNA polymerase omega subunit
MTYQDLSMTKVFRQIPNRFLLSVAVSKRARQLREGYRPLVEVTEENPNPVLIALREIEQGKLNVIVKERHNAEEEYLERMEQDLELQVAEQESEKDEKKPVKDTKETKTKAKARSLAA